MEARKWRRCSLRPMLGVIGLVCISLASWEICKHRAVADIKFAADGLSPKVVAPYLFCIEKSDNVTVVATYHVWCFGFICKLPYSRKFPETGGFYSVVRPRVIIQEEEPDLLGTAND